MPYTWGIASFGAQPRPLCYDRALWAFVLNICCVCVAFFDYFQFWFIPLWFIQCLILIITDTSAYQCYSCFCMSMWSCGLTAAWCVSDLMPEPAVRDLRSASVPQYVVLHALHTGVLSYFRAIRRLIVLHLCKEKHTTKIWAAHHHPTFQNKSLMSLCLAASSIMFLSPGTLPVKGVEIIRWWSEDQNELTFHDNFERKLKEREWQSKTVGLITAQNHWGVCHPNSQGLFTKGLSSFFSL